MTNAETLKLAVSNDCDGVTDETEGTGQEHPLSDIEHAHLTVPDDDADGFPVVPFRFRQRGRRRLQGMVNEKKYA